MEPSLGGRPECSKTRGGTQVFALIFKSSPSYQMQIQPLIKRRQSALLNCRLSLICKCHSTWQLIYVQHLKLQMQMQIRIQLMQIQMWHLFSTFEAAETDDMSRIGDQLCNKFEDARNLNKNNHQSVSCSQKVCHVSPGRLM